MKKEEASGICISNGWLLVLYFLITLVITFIIYFTFTFNNGVYKDHANAIAGAFSVSGVFLSIFIYKLTERVEKKLKFVDLIKIRQYMKQKKMILQGLSGCLESLKNDRDNSKILEDTKYNLLQILSILHNFRAIMKTNCRKNFDKVYKDVQELNFFDSNALDDFKSELAMLIGEIKYGFEEEFGAEESGEN